MADDTSATDDPGPRPTVALVDAKLDTVKAQIKAGFGVIDGHFTDVQRQLDQVAGLPIKVTKLEGAVDNLTTRVGTLEEEEERGATWRRIHLPTILISAGLLGTSIILAVEGFIRH